MEKLFLLGILIVVLTIIFLTTWLSRSKKFSFVRIVAYLMLFILWFISAFGGPEGSSLQREFFATLIAILIGLLIRKYGKVE
ncbi:MAG: hypothetical protein ACM3UZ_02610 [Acidobacteriota bacterium]